MLIPGLIVGVQQSLKSRLTIRLQQMVKINPSLINESSINVKITGNGIQVSQSMHILMLAFTILDGNANPNSPSGNYTIAMLNAQEKYEHLLHVIKDIANEIESMQSIIIDGHEFNIQFLLGAEILSNLPGHASCKCLVLLYMVQVPSWRKIRHLKIMVLH